VRSSADGVQDAVLAELSYRGHTLAVTRHRDSRIRSGPHTQIESGRHVYVAQLGLPAIDSALSAVQA